MARISLRDKLFLLTTLSGVAFIATQLECAALDFHALGSAFPAVAPAFQEQQGFFNILRWAESLHTPQDMEVLVRMVSRSVSNTTTPPSSCGVGSGEFSLPSTSSPQYQSVRTEPEPFHVQLAKIASFETYVHASKMLLQCGILLFLYRLRMLPRWRAVPAICLCVLVLLCWKMAQSCLRELLSSSGRPLRGTAFAATGAPSTRDFMAVEMKAAFLNMLFLLRFAATTVVNGVIGRAYQLYFCAPWPESWRHVPRYLGSKDLVLSTLYYAAAAVAAVSVSCAALRSLSEAAMQFESAALSCSLLHFVFFRITHEGRLKPV